MQNQNCPENKLNKKKLVEMICVHHNQTKIIFIIAAPTRTLTMIILGYLQYPFIHFKYPNNLKLTQLINQQQPNSILIIDCKILIYTIPINYELYFSFLSTNQPINQPLSQVKICGMANSCRFLFQLIFILNAFRITFPIWFCGLWKYQANALWRANAKNS